MVALYLNGKSLRYLCAYLDAEGIPTRRGGSWVPKTLSDVLRNPVLAGRQVDGKGRTLLRVPPILDPDTWRKLQAELDRKASKKAVARESPMLAGIAVCGICGGPIQAWCSCSTAWISPDSVQVPPGPCRPRTCPAMYR